MLKGIAEALQSFNEHGIAVIVGSDGNDPREIADYVLPILQGLKCSIRHYYNEIEHSYFIVDTANDVSLNYVSNTTKDYLLSLISATTDYILINKDVLEENVADHLQCAIDHINSVFDL